MKQHILALLLTMLCPALFYGQDTYFTYQSGENELRFRLLDDGTVGLVGNPDWLYTGDVVVPAAIEVEGKSYRVTATCGGGDNNDPYYEGTDATSAFNVNSIDSEGLRSITLPEGLLHIANFSFYNVPVKELKIPSTVESIGQMSSMSELLSLEYPEKVTRVVAYGFYIFPKLETVVLGPNVNYIEEPAFINCGSLKRIYFKAEVPPTLEKDPFDQLGIWDLSKITAYVPKGCLEDYKEAWPDFEFTYVELDYAGLSVGSITQDNEVKAICTTAGIQVTNVNSPIMVGLYDTLGRTIYIGTVEHDTTIPLKLATSQIYILKTGSKCTKITIRY